MNREELLKVAKPILFNTEMVRAILDGKKTVTRRIVKFLDNRNPNWTGYVKDGLTLYNGKNEPCNKPAPYKVGDILYVRESVFQGVASTLLPSGEYECFNTSDFEYYADGLHCKEHWKDEYQHVWMHRRPSIHMPKEAARIFLKITHVRVERLKEIAIEQCKAEGIQAWTKDGRTYKYAPADCEGDAPMWPWQETPRTYRNAMKKLWDGTVKKTDVDKYGWDANPWVFVIEFERVDVE